MPAAVLVFLVLGALAVDTAVVFLAQRQLANAAVAAANDAAAAVDVERFYQDGSLRLLPAQAQRVAEESVGRVDLDHLGQVRPAVRVGDGVVEVTITATVERIFARAVPGGSDHAEVAARAIADTERG